MKKKIFILDLLILSLTFLAILRLFYLQIIQGKKYEQLANENRIRKIKISGPRGIIFDRHGEILAKNQPIFKLKLPNQEKIISRDEALSLQAKNEDENLYIDYIRVYPQGSDFAHIVGYLGEVGEENKGDYQIGDLIGQTGVEKFYEEKLKGKNGGELVEVDATGKILRKIGKIDPTRGENLILSIDADLQRIAARQMAGKKGAVVGTNPKTGEVLILYSSPSFDPNVFVSSRSEREISFLISDEKNTPLVNRAISGIYPPGSTFKIVTSVAGLEDGKISKNTLINDPGIIYVGPYKFANWFFTGYGKTEGEINIVRAIKRSTDTFFYKLGEMVGIERLIFWAKKFNLDKNFGIDLPGEISGFIPSPEWKMKVKKEPWFLGNTYHLSIGQGDLALTPLGVNMMTQVIADYGKICKPRIIKAEIEEKIECLDLKIKKETIEIVKEGMEEACSFGGTAWPFFEWNGNENWVSQKGKVACKTGTAEYVDQDGRNKTHAWFTIFAPSYDPKIVLTVLVEGGGEGSSVAAPIAKEILKEYFR